MNVTLEQAIAAISKPERGGEALKEFEWGMMPETTQTYVPWQDTDFELFENETGCKIPTQLEQLLRQYAIVHITGPDPEALQYDAFLAQWHDGSQSTHTVKTFLDRRQTMLDNFHIFSETKLSVNNSLRNMIFFGDADGGHSHLLMNGADQNDNAVYLWETASPTREVELHTDSIAVCANTLYEFMCDLTPLSELPSTFSTR